MGRQEKMRGRKEGRENERGGGREKERERQR